MDDGNAPDSQPPDGQTPDPAPDRGPERDERTGRSAAAERIRHQTQWVELQLQRAMERGEFDNLPGYGKPIKDLGDEHDPEWWLKRLVEREQVTGVLPPSLQVRKDDAELDGLLDKETTERGVRREVEEFNERVRKARIQPLGGPPMITKERDVETEVEAWRQRRNERIAAHRELLARAEREQKQRRRWWRPRRSPGGEAQGR
jgi:hypothetical protein